MTHVLVHEARAHDVTRVVLALERGGLHPRLGDAETLATPWASTGGLAGVPVLVPETEVVAAQELIAGLEAERGERARSASRALGGRVAIALALCAGALVAGRWDAGDPALAAALFAVASAALLWALFGEETGTGTRGDGE